MRWKYRLLSLGMISVFALIPAESIHAQKKKAKGEPPTREGLLKEVKPVEGFVASIFAVPPDVSYPTCLCAAPTGEVYVGVDHNGSLGPKQGQGKVVRCVDTDSDGVADEFKTFCEVDSPRGLFFDRGKLFVLHPPFLTAFYDDDGDGKADRSEVLVKGIGSDLTVPRRRPHDQRHPPRHRRLALHRRRRLRVHQGRGQGRQDACSSTAAASSASGPTAAGWRSSRAASATSTTSRSTRCSNLFTRDNTNDGGGWDVRLSHVVPPAHYGYPSLFTNFADEIIQPLADYGGGSPSGSLFVDEPGLPDGSATRSTPVDWGRSGGLPPPAHAARARAYDKPSRSRSSTSRGRPTWTSTAAGRIYLSSWRGGGFNFSRPERRLRRPRDAEDWKYEPFPDVSKRDRQQDSSASRVVERVRRQYGAARNPATRAEAPDVAQRTRSDHRAGDVDSRLASRHCSRSSNFARRTESARNDHGIGQGRRISASMRFAPRPTASAKRRACRQRG